MSNVLFPFQEDELRKAILVVLANKQDLEGHMTATEVTNALGLTYIKNRNWHIVPTSAIKGDGLKDAMEW
jgi:ADP-ribosylation factor-like protein 1